MIDLFGVGKDETSETVKYLFRAANVWWGWEQYYVSCVQMPDNRCMYISHVCFMSIFFSFGVLKYVCVRDVMDVVFSVCIVSRGAVGARVRDV